MDQRRKRNDVYLLQSRNDLQENLSNCVDTGVYAQDSVRNQVGQ